MLRTVQPVVVPQAPVAAPVVAPRLAQFEQDHLDRMQTRKMMDCLINVVSPLTRSVGGSVEERVYTLLAILMSQSEVRKRSEGLELEELRCVSKKTVDKEELAKISNLAQARQEKLKEIMEEARNQTQMLNQISQALQDSVRQAVKVGA